MPVTTKTLTEQVAEIVTEARQHRQKRGSCSWSDYEIFKAKIAALWLAPRHYQRAIASVIDALGL